MSDKYNKNLLEFNNYKEFLLDFVEHKKNSNPNWSYSQWARDLKLKSTSSITKILNNERLPGKSIVGRLIDYFEFNEQQTYYFLDLIELEKTKANPALQKTFLERVKAKKLLQSFDEIEVNKFNLISHWYYFAIRELTKIKDFKKSPYWIQKKLNKKVSIKQINEAIKVLLSLKLLKKQGDKIKHSDQTVNTKNDLSSLAIKSYHSQILGLANESLFEDDVLIREFQSGCFSFKKSDLPQAKKMIRNFLQEFAGLNSKNNGDEIYQIAVQFFPLSSNDQNKGTKN